MQTPGHWQIYPYCFLLGSCLIWYGTSEIHPQVFFALLTIPILFFYRSGRLLAFFLMGCIFAEIIAISQQQWQFPETHARDRHLLTGTIEGLPENKGEIVRLRFKLQTINHQAKSVNKDIYLRLSCYRDCPEFLADQKWQLLVRLKPNNGYINPQAFDYEKWLYAEQFKATGYIVPSGQNQLLAWNKGVDSLREIIRKYLILHLDEPIVRASAIALTLGDKSHLSSRQQQQLAENGLSHLMAISGLHIGLSAIPGFFLAGFLWRRVGVFQQFNRLQFQWILSLVPAIAYTALSGFGLPAWRALVMLLVFATGYLFRNSISTHTRFVMALWFIVLTQPLAPLQISFWLSFCATAILIFLGKLYRSDSPVLGLMILQSRLFILLMPVQLLIFNNVSMLSPVINFFAIPFVSIFLLPLLLLLVILIIISVIFSEPASFNTQLPGTEGVVWLVEQLLTLFWKTLSYIEPVTQSVQFSISDLAVWHLLAYPLLIMLLLQLQWRLKAIILLLLFLLLFNDRSTTTFRMMVLDVGQGLAITVDYAEQLLIYDTAYGSIDFVVGELTLLPWLQLLQTDSISLLVISHNDADHSGGSQLLMDSFQVSEIISSPDVELSSEVRFPPRSITTCQQGQNWQWQDLSISVLSTAKADKTLFNRGNDSSCVVLMTIKGYKILLTGDIETAAEQQLLKNHPDLTANVILVPHHGSKTSSTWPFIQQLQPQFAIVSSGYLNRFNLPAESILKRYQKNAVKVFNTASSGAIELTINSHGTLAIRQLRLDNARLWRRHD